MAVDLHTHSTASDGSDDPVTLVEKAAAMGLSTIALTDHDTQDGIALARSAAERMGVELVPGTELSLEFMGGMHLLVLWLEPGPGPLQDRLGSLRQGRTGRNESILALLTDHGMPLTMDEVLEQAGEGSVGRPHIAAVMVRRGYVASIAEAFELWLAAGKPAYANRPRLTPEEAIGLAVQSRGVPILAHPHTLGINRADEMAEVLDRLLSAGLIGMETMYAAYHRHEREGYTHLARRFGLSVSGGSDYHGTYKEGLELGRGYGDLEVPESVLEDLRDRRPGA